MNNKILLIDGNYFAMRCLGTLNMGDAVNNLITDEEKSNFMSCMNLQLIKLWESFSVYCDRMIFCADSYSWRKELPSYRPFYVDEKDIQSGLITLGYKKQRDKIKEESDIDYDAFYELFNKFIEEIKEDVNVVRSKGLEGDDIINLLSKQLSEKGNEVIIFCTDNDLTQLSRHNIILFRNIRSKKAPFGEVILSSVDAQKMNEKKSLNQSLLFEKDVSKMNGLYSDLLSINLIDDSNKAVRKPGQGLEIAEPNKIILKKCITGDKSDNILPLLRWKSSNGKINYSCTEKHIEQAFENTFEPYTENSCREYLQNPEYIKHLLENLILVTKVNEKSTKKAKINDVFEHFRYNLKLVFLYQKLIPPLYYEEFIEKYDNYQDKMKMFDVEKFKRDHTINIKDSALSFLERSII